MDWAIMLPPSPTAPRNIHSYQTEIDGQQFYQSQEVQEPSEQLELVLW